MSTILAWMLSGWELVVIGGVALLLFGRRLPEVMRSMGRGVVEFKRGLREIEEDVDSASQRRGPTVPPPPPPPPPPARE